MCKKYMLAKVHKKNICRLTDVLFYFFDQMMNPFGTIAPFFITTIPSLTVYSAWSEFGR